MDQRTAAIINGYTEVLAEIVRLLVRKNLLSRDDVEDRVTQVLVRGIEQGAQPGFDEVPVNLLKIIESWKSAPP